VPFQSKPGSRALRGWVGGGGLGLWLGVDGVNLQSLTFEKGEPKLLHLQAGDQEARIALSVKSKGCVGGWGLEPRTPCLCNCICILTSVFRAHLVYQKVRAPIV
jgi:hypothetical protein